uniref:Hsp70 family protein n=1 Tax=Rhodococcus rhodochrous TaxID=1829 RepID=UPI0012FE1B19
EIERMVKEAELNAEADKQRKEAVEVRNEADQLVFTTEKTLKEVEGKVDQAEIDKANEAKDKVKKALEGGTLDEIKTAKDELSQIIQQISVKLYEQAAQAAQAAQGASAQDASGDAKKENVVDADYEVVDDKK